MEICSKKYQTLKITTMKKTTFLIMAIALLAINTADAPKTIWPAKE